MDIIRNLLITLWCAAIAGAGVFALVALYRYSGGNDTLVGATWRVWIAGAMLAVAAFLSLIKPIFLWAVIAICTIVLIVGANPYMFVSNMLGRGGDGTDLVILTLVGSLILACWEQWSVRSKKLASKVESESE